MGSRIFKLIPGAPSLGPPPPTHTIFPIASSSESRPILTVPINKVLVPCLFDTGSEVTLLNWNIFQTLPGCPKLHPAKTQLVSANNSRLNMVGSTVLTFTLGTTEANQEVIIVKGLASQCIIGIDLMTSAGIQLELTSRKVIMPSASTPLRSLKRCVIPPWSAVLIATIGPPRKNTDQDVIVNPFSAEAPWAQETEVTKLTNGIVHLRLLNPSDLPLSIPRGTPLATLEPLSFYETRSVNEIFIAPVGSNSSPLELPPHVLEKIPLQTRPGYRRLLQEFHDIFSRHPDDVGKCDLLPQHIILKDPNKVASTPPYRIPHHLQEVALQYVDKLLRANVIRPSKSPFSSPLLLVKKPGVDDPTKPLIERWRVVHDYRKVNLNTVVDSYPMHHIYDLIDKVSQARVWSVIDLSSGFFNQVLDENSRKYTAFGLPGVGHWEYTRSAQGLCNSPASFQRLLDQVIQGVPNCYVYIDDLVVASASHEEHITDLRNVFSRLKKHNIKCRVNKLQIGSPKITYLGYDLSHEHGIQPGIIKTNAIRNWPPPSDVSQVRQFLGLCSFFRRCVPNFASIASPLTQLTRKDSPWKSGPLPPPALAAFEALRTTLSNRPCLAPVNFKQEFILTCDASTSGLGAILSQRDINGIEHPCAYASRVLNTAERKLAPFHLEHLAMTWACRHFRPYLLGKHFTLRTDHKPLTALNKVQGCAFDRLRAELDEYQPFTVCLLYTSPSPRDLSTSRMPSSA